MSNYSRGEFALAGSDFFGGGRDGAMKRQIVNAIIGAHPTKEMLLGKDWKNYPAPMQLRGGRPTEDGVLNEAYTVWTTMRVDRMTTIPKSLHGEGFYYDPEFAYDLAKVNYQPARRGHIRNHDGENLTPSEGRWTLDSVMKSPSGEPYRYYVHNDEDGVLTASLDGTEPHTTTALIKVSNEDYGRAGSIEEAHDMIAKGKKVVKVDGSDIIVARKDTALTRDVLKPEQVNEVVAEFVGQSYSPQRANRARQAEKNKDLTGFAYRAIKRVAAIDNPETDTPLGVLAEMSKGEFENWLDHGRLAIANPARAALGYGTTSDSDALAMRSMAVWDQMISKMHALNVHNSLGINHAVLQAAGDKIIERIIKANYEQAKKSNPALTSDEHLRNQMSMREQYREASRMAMLRFIASYDVTNSVDGTKIPAESFRRVHDAVIEAGKFSKMDVVDKVNLTVALLIKDLRESGNGDLARKLNRLIARKMDDADKRLKENAKSLIADGSVSLNWRETKSLQDGSKVTVTDLTGHYIREMQETQIGDITPFGLKKQLKKLGYVVNSVMLPDADALRAYGNGDIKMSDVRKTNQEVFIVLGPNERGKMVEQFAFAPAIVEAQQQVNYREVKKKGTREAKDYDTRSALGKELGVDLNAGEVAPTVQTTETSATKLVNTEKSGLRIWQPDRETGVIDFNVDMYGYKSRGYNKNNSTVSNFSQMRGLGGVPAIQKLARAVTKTTTKYGIYRPHGNTLTWQGGNRLRQRNLELTGIPEVDSFSGGDFDWWRPNATGTRGTGVEALGVADANISSKIKLFESMDAAKSAILDDIVSNYSQSVHLRSHVGEVSGKTKDELLSLISASTGTAFGNKGNFSVFKAGEFVLITGKYDNGKMRSLKGMTREEIVGSLKREPAKKDKFVSFSNYAELYRYSKGNEDEGTRTRFERVLGDGENSFKTEGDVRRFLNNADMKPSSYLKKLVIADRVDAAIKRLSEERESLARSLIADIMVKSRKEIREIDKKLSAIMEPVISITQKVRSTYRTEVKGQDLSPSEQVARLFDLRLKDGSYAAGRVVMRDINNTKYAPPSESIYRQSRGAKRDSVGRRIQAVDENGKPRFNDNNEPIYEVKEETLQNDDVEDLMEYMEPIMDNQMAEIFKAIGFLEDARVSWRTLLPNEVLGFYDDHKKLSKDKDIDGRAKTRDLFESKEEGVLEFRRIAGSKTESIAEKMKYIKEIAEVYVQLSKRYDEYGDASRIFAEDPAYISLTDRRQKLVTQLAAALGMEDKSGNASMKGVKVTEMTESQLKEFSDAQMAKMAEYEKNIQGTPEEVDMKLRTLISEGRANVAGNARYLPLDENDSRLATTAELREFANRLRGDIMELSSSLLTALETTKFEKLMQILKASDTKNLSAKEKEVLTKSVNKGLTKAQLESAQKILAYLKPTTAEEPVSTVEKRNIDEIIKSMSVAERERLGPVEQEVFNLVNRFVSEAKTTERIVREKEYEFILSHDPAQAFMKIVTESMRSPEAMKYFGTISDKFQSIIEAVNRGSVVDTQRLVNELVQEFPRIATAQHASPFLAEARKYVTKELLTGAGESFTTTKVWQELFGSRQKPKNARTKNEIFQEQEGAQEGAQAATQSPLRGLMDTHGLFSEQVMSWLRENTMTLSQKRASGESTSKKILIPSDFMANIESMKSRYDAEVERINKTREFFNTGLLNGLNQMSKQRDSIDREIAKVYSDFAKSGLSIYDSQNGVGLINDLLKTMGVQDNPNFVELVRQSVDESFQRIRDEIHTHRIEFEYQMDDFREKLRVIRTSAKRVGQRLEQLGFEPHKLHSNASDVAKMFPDTFTDMSGLEVVPIGMRLNSADRGTSGRPAGASSKPIKDVTHQVMKNESVLREFRRAFGVAEVELFEKAEALLDYHTKFPNSEIKPEHASLIARYFPDEAEPLKQKIAEHISVEADRRRLLEGYKKYDLHKDALNEAMSRVTGNEEAIAQALVSIYGAAMGKTRLKELKDQAFNKRKTLTVDLNDLKVEEAEVAIWGMSEIVLSYGEDGVPRESVTAIDLLEGPMFREWADQHLSSNIDVNDAEGRVTNSIFETTAEQTAWVNTPFRDKMVNIGETKAKITEAARMEVERKRNETLAALAEISRQAKYEKDAEQSLQTEKDILADNDARRIQSIRHLFTQLKGTDMAMRSFRQRSESFFKNRTQARNNLLSVRDAGTLMPIPLSEHQKVSSTKGNDEFLETPNGRYMAIKRPNGSISLIFQGYNERGVSLSPRQIGVFPDAERAQVAIRFADDDISRAIIIADYASKNGEQPPSSLSIIGNWANEFLESNRNLLSESEYYALKNRLATVGIYPEDAMIELKGLGRARKIQIYPEGKMWDLLHSSGEYEKGADGVWRRLPFRDIEREANRKIDELRRSQVNPDNRQEVGASERTPDMSMSDGVSDAVDSLTNFEVREEAPIFGGGMNSQVGSDWIILRNKLGYELRRIQEHKNGKWITHYRMFNPAAAMIALSQSEEEAVSEMLKDFINGNK
jgi:hypothetical protein